MIRCALVPSVSSLVPSRKLLFLAVLLAAQLSFGQGPVTGTPKFNSFGGGPFDIINLGNLNVHFAIPVIHKAGRGLPFNYDISYDSSIWTPGTVNTVLTWQPVGGWGWQSQTDAATGYIPPYTLVSDRQYQCNPGTGHIRIYRYSGFVDSLGTVVTAVHIRRVVTNADGGCP
ncbi:MAG TPA: hypothetical protein VN948_20070 [Terriglobales bacterium]|nr:hypothetical protein [Terriglobales bacterium]